MFSKQIGGSYQDITLPTDESRKFFMQQYNYQKNIKSKKMKKF